MPDLPENEIIEDYKSNSWYTVKRLANKYKTTSYYITKILKSNNVKMRVKQFNDEQLNEIKKRPKKDEKIQIVKRFIKPERYNSSEDLKQHLQILDRILINYPDKSFWLTVKLKFKLNSLAWFFTEEGKKVLSQKYKIFKTDFSFGKKEEVSLENTKVGEDLITKKKAKNLKEFING